MKTMIYRVDTHLHGEPHGSPQSSLSIHGACMVVESLKKAIPDAACFIYPVYPAHTTASDGSPLPYTATLRRAISGDVLATYYFQTGAAAYEFAVFLLEEADDATLYRVDVALCGRDIGTPCDEDPPKLRRIKSLRRP